MCSWTESDGRVSPADAAKTVAHMNQQAIAAGRPAHPAVPAKANGRLSADGQDRVSSKNRASLSPFTRDVLARRDAQRAAAFGQGGILDQCQQPNQVRQIDRSEACFTTFHHARLFRNGVFSGEAVHKVTMYIFTLGPAWRFNAFLEYVGDSLQLGPVNISVGFECSGACRKFADDKLEFRVGTGKVDVGALYEPTISGANQAAFGSSILSISASSPRADQPSTIPLQTAGSRCDSMFDPNPWGCVFPDGTSQRFFVEADFYPAAVEHIIAAQEAGAPGHDVALTRITNDRAISINRSTACPRGLRPAGMSCDEYPFATTKEGAGSDPTRGHTFTWCFVDWLPDVSVVPGAPWSARCSRSWTSAPPPRGSGVQDPLCVLAAWSPQIRSW